MRNQAEEQPMKEPRPDAPAEATQDKPCVLDDIQIEELAVDGICGIY